MAKQTLIKLLIALGVFISTIGVFKLLQDPGIYDSTLGKISCNYERVKNDRKYQVVQANKPYINIDHSNIYRWDATIYKSIADSSYSGSERSFKERLAFYPLFPMIWKATHINSPLIFVFCYFFFIAGLILLSNLSGLTKSTNTFIFTLSILLPSAMTYYLPYAEPVFFTSLVITFWGLIKKNYWLFFIGAFAFAMSRPAAIIFIMALLAADLRYLIAHRNFRYFIRELTMKLLPFVLGFLTVTFIQYSYAGSWTAYFDAQVLWPAESGLFNTITDWSKEGFGMSVFAIFFVAIPSLIYSIIWGIKAFTKEPAATPASLFSTDEKWIKEYIFHASILFTAGNLVYTFLTSGNALNGVYRYTMVVPCFYFILFLLPERLKEISFKNKMIAFGSCLTLMVIFLTLVVYGGNRFVFTYTGLYLSIALLLFFLTEPYLSIRNKIILFLLLVIPCIAWHTYLFNMYLSDAWLFT